MLNQDKAFSRFRVPRLLQAEAFRESMPSPRARTTPAGSGGNP